MPRPTPLGVRRGMGRTVRGRRARWTCGRGGPALSCCPLPLLRSWPPAARARADGAGRADRRRRRRPPTACPRGPRRPGPGPGRRAGGRRAQPDATSPEPGQVPDDFLPGQRRRLHPGRLAARLVGHVARADRQPPRGRPRAARRGAAPAVGAARRDVQLRGGRGARPLARRRPRPRAAPDVADGPLRRAAARTCRRRSTRSRRPTASSTRSRRRPRACAAGPARPRGRGPLVSTRVARLRVGRMFCTQVRLR